MSARELDARAYEMGDPDERARLVREVKGYLFTCRSQHHGTDWSGRAFALAALDELPAYLEASLPPGQTPHSQGDVREALESLRSDAAHVIDFYNRNGPTWTGKDGHEYADMSAVIERAEETIAKVEAALNTEGEGQ
jgi:hypothetical protein